VAAAIGEDDARGAADPYADVVEVAGELLLGLVHPQHAGVGAADGGDRVVAVVVPGEADRVAVAVAVDVDEDGRVRAEPGEDLGRGAAAAADGGDAAQLRGERRAPAAPNPKIAE